MCGICGFWGQRPDAEKLAERMAARIHHRGPDSFGTWGDPDSGCTLAHRRLAIVDLSPAGHQPMTSRSQRYVISFNGEIYNHLELRARLEAVSPRSWRGHSDTETLLECFSEWGIEKTLQAASGMFAIALWDREERRLHLARDRMGEKPLYWGRLGGEFVFASELKALHAHPAWTGEVDRDALALFFRHNYVPGPYSIHKGLHKLPPGTWLTVSENGTRVTDPKTYWSLKDVVEAGSRDPFTGTPDQAVDALENVLGEAIGLQMMADVPLGAFLSGGYDSSAVVALMQARSKRPVRTFSIGFSEEAYNEAEHAKAVASHLGTEHTELYVTPRDALNVIPELPGIWDEPFADSSQIPTLLLSRMTRQQVTVSLSGDGGDELFCGYSRYEMGRDTWSRLSRIPAGLRELMGAVVEKIPGAAATTLKGRAELFRSGTREDFYRQLVSHFRRPGLLVPGAQEPPTSLTTPASHPPLRDLREMMLYLDSVSYLPDDVLVKVDRAAMATSLETRVPLLDPRVVEFAWRLPMSLKDRDGKLKWVLREMVHRHVPRTMMERPKMGFGVPISDWLRGPLKDWASALLSEQRLREEGYLNPALVTRLWKEHSAGTRNWSGHLWDVLMFQAWLEAMRKDAA